MLIEMAIAHLWCFDWVRCVESVPQVLAGYMCKVCMRVQSTFSSFMFLNVQESWFINSKQAQVLVSIPRGNKPMLNSKE